MKILFFYTYNSGFLSNFFQDLSKLLIQDGYDVVVSYIKNKDKEFIDNGIKFIEFQDRNYISKFRNIYKVIKLERPDTIISNFGYINPALLFGKILKVTKNIAWMHTVYGHQQPSNLKVINKIFHLKFADVVITNSHELNKEMSKIYNVPKRKVKSLPFWTSINDISVADITEIPNLTGNDIKVGCPGRLLKDKNQAIVIKALSDLQQINEKTHLYFAGEGQNLGSLKQIVNDCNINTKVHFLGFLSSRQMKFFYQSMDVIVLPSLNESFGLVLIEAMAMGVPVIVSNKFGALGFIDDGKYPRKQFTFDPKSIEDLKSKLMPYTNKHGLNGQYFEEIYQSTFKKEEIYQVFLRIINSN